MSSYTRRLTRAWKVPECPPTRPPRHPRRLALAAVARPGRRERARSPLESLRIGLRGEGIVAADPNRNERCEPDVVELLLDQGAMPGGDEAHDVPRIRQPAERTG